MSVLLVTLANIHLLDQLPHLLVPLVRMTTVKLVVQLLPLDNVLPVMMVMLRSVENVKSALPPDVRLVLMQPHVPSVSKIIIMEVVLVLLVLLVYTHLLNQVPHLHVSLVLMTTVKLVALVTPPQNVPFARTLSMFLQVFASLAMIPIVILALQLELENAHHALPVFTC